MAPVDHSPTRCELCKTPLQNAAVVLGEKFIHPQCFQCQRCKQTLSTSSGAEYNEINGGKVCLSCGMMCYGCHRPTSDKQIVRLLGRDYHVDCANCYSCEQRLVSGAFFYMFGNEPHCLRCGGVKTMFAGT